MNVSPVTPGPLHPPQAPSQPTLPDAIRRQRAEYLQGAEGEGRQEALELLDNHFADARFTLHFRNLGLTQLPPGISDATLLSVGEGNFLKQIPSELPKLTIFDTTNFIEMLLGPPASFAPSIPGHPQSTSAQETHAIPNFHGNGTISAIFNGPDVILLDHQTRKTGNYSHEAFFELLRKHMETKHGAYYSTRQFCKSTFDNLADRTAIVSFEKNEASFISLRDFRSEEGPVAQASAGPLPRIGSQRKRPSVGE